MEGHRLDKGVLAAYAEYLLSEERAAGTVEKYMRELTAFLSYAGERGVTKEIALAWKQELVRAGYAPRTVNGKLSAVNGLFRYLGWGLQVKFLKVQRRVFRDPGRELERSEYRRLVEAARAEGQERLELVMEAICATGIRVSEVRYLTVEAVRAGRAEIALKGKIRTILLPEKLRRKLMKYANRQKTASGEIFLTRSGKPLSRGQIWREMKQLCRRAGVAAAKVFPHNLRHLFAVTFYRSCRDIVRLADVLGHSSIETTRIYLLTSSAEHARQLNRLGLIS